MESYNKYTKKKKLYFINVEKLSRWFLYIKHVNLKYGYVSECYKLYFQSIKPLSNNS